MSRDIRIINAEKTINYLLSCGFENVKIIYVEKEKNIDTMSGKGINSKKTFESGFSISFYKDKDYFIALNNLDSFYQIKKKIKLLVNNINKINNSNECSIDDNLFAKKEKEICSFDLDRFKKELLEFLKNKKDSINVSIPFLKERKKTIVMSNDNSVVKEEIFYKIDIIISALINNKNRFNYYSKGAINDNTINKLDLTKELNVLYDSLLKMKSGEKINKKTTVVLSNGIGGVLIHETCGHALESREIIKNTSVLNNINNIDNNIINIIDDPLIKGKLGSFLIDDEGNKAHKRNLINKGVIKNYLCDERGEKILNDYKAGSCRRESYYNLLSSRMSNTFLKEGNNSFEDIIKSVEDGYYVKNIVGGVVDTISGNFSFNCIETYKKKNGIIDYSECYDNLSLIGNTITVLNNIDMIGNDLELSCGICGSESGFIYTTVGQPTIRINNISMVS